MTELIPFDYKSPNSIPPAKTLLTKSSGVRFGSGCSGSHGLTQQRALVSIWIATFFSAVEIKRVPSVAIIHRVQDVTAIIRSSLFLQKRRSFSTHGCAVEIPATPVARWLFSQKHSNSCPKTGSSGPCGRTRDFSTTRCSLSSKQWAFPTSLSPA